MQCPKDIKYFNNVPQDDQVYTFLDGLGDRFYNIRSNMLQLKLFSTVEQVYAHVSREAVRQAVMTTNDGEDMVGAMLASRSLKRGPPL